MIAIEMKAVGYSKPDYQFYSNLTSKANNCEFFVKTISDQTANAVLFEDMISSMVTVGFNAYIELG